MRSTLQILSDITRSQSLELLLVGGYALQAYGVARQTMDVDCLVKANDSGRLDESLRNAGYKSAGKTENFHRYRSDSIYLMDVDVLFVDSETMGKLLKDAVKFSLQNEEFRVPSIINFIALKLHAIKNDPAREARDISDITEVLRMNKGEVSRKELEEICGRYGPEGIFVKLEVCRPWK